MKRIVLFIIICLIASTNAFTQNVGIGTNTPAYPLTVYSPTTGIVQKGPNVEIGFGVSAFAGYLRTLTNHPLHFATNNGPSQMVLTTTGELGLGIALPNARLHMVGNISNMLLMDNTAALNPGVNNRILFKTGAYYTGMIGTVGTSSSTGRMGFYTQASSMSSSLAERMTIQNNGYVGINNTSPAFQLDVNGSANISGTLEIGGTLNKSTTGNMNWLPIVIANVNADGLILGGSGNIGVQKLGTGSFKVGIAGEANLYNDRNKYAIFVSALQGYADLIANAKIVNDNTIEVTLTRPHVEYWNDACGCSNTSRITSGTFYQAAFYGFNIMVYKF